MVEIPIIFFLWLRRDILLKVKDVGLNMDPDGQDRRQ